MIDKAKVNGFGAATLLRGDAVKVGAKYFGSGGSVNVFTFSEGFE